MVAIMYVEHVRSKRGNKVYTQILLRESYRERGAPRSAVKHRTLLNLTHCPPEDVAAIELALRCKNDLSALREACEGKVRRKQGRSVGAVWLLYRVAQRIGLVRALGRSQQGRRALWQVFARLIDQGSRLSAVRLAKEHAACEVIGLHDFNENDLYLSLDWLDARQAKIENALYKRSHGDRPPKLFLYDVTSSYLEGTQNAYGAYGYNRDGKRGKMQIVVGLLTDEEGVPLSVQVFQGNTQDPQTVPAQIRKLAGRFGVRNVTLVGDRGMLKSLQIEALQAESLHYLTAITKPQIEALMKAGTLQLELFDEKLCEVRLDDGVRYLLRRNPLRAAEIAAGREDKFACVCGRVANKNAYLREHGRASPQVAMREIKAHVEKLRIEQWTTLRVQAREIRIQQDTAALERAARLDGCYVLKSDVSADQVDAEHLHARYKDLAQVERAFRTMKTGHLEVRPVFVRTPAHTRAHVFIVMLAYRLRCELEAAWRHLDLTVEEGLEQLSTLCADEILLGLPGKHDAGCLSVPEPRDSLAQLFEACEVTPPTNLPRRHTVVATKRKLPSRRKNH